jgi:hypothetical protein
MVAYAVRDAEMTLALYYWLDEHYSWALKLHESTNLHEPVAAWIEPFLRGSSSFPAVVVVAEAMEQGSIVNREQVVADCRAALTTITNPMRCNRLLRLIADLSLVELSPAIEPLLTAQPSEVRAGAVRALSRMNVEHAKDIIRPLLHDPVQDVRKAAQAALRIHTRKEPHDNDNLATRVKSADGTRRWTVGNPNDADTTNESDWKARLRSIISE